MLRRLEQKDAVYMLEWMHDETITCNFRYPFAAMTLERAKIFICLLYTSDAADD